MNSQSANSTKRIEKLRSARNVNEIVAVLRDIAIAIKKTAPKTNDFIEAISSARFKSKDLSRLLPEDSSAKVRLVISPSLSARSVRPGSAKPADRAQKPAAKPAAKPLAKPSVEPQRANIPSAEIEMDWSKDADFGKMQTLTDTTVGSRRNGNSIKPIALAKFSSPSVKALAEHNEVLQQDFQYSRELKYAIQLLSTGSDSEASKRNVAMRAAVQLYEAVSRRINHAMDSLDDLLQKHMPSPMQKAANSIEQHLLKAIPKDRYTDHYNYGQVSQQGKAIVFTVYMIFNELKSDTGYVFDSYYVVLTGKVENSALTLYLNTLPEFRISGQYPIGTPISSLNNARVNALLDEFLAQHDVSVQLNRAAMPVSDAQLKGAKLTKIPGVVKAEVSDDTVRLYLTAAYSPAAKHSEVAAPVLVMLNRLINNRGRNKFAYKSVKHNNKTALEFILLNASPGTRRLKKSDLNDLQEMLDLTDAQVTHIREAQRNVD